MHLEKLSGNFLTLSNFPIHQTGKFKRVVLNLHGTEEQVESLKNRLPSLETILSIEHSKNKVFQLDVYPEVQDTISFIPSEENPSLLDNLKMEFNLSLASQSGFKTMLSKYPLNYSLRIFSPDRYAGVYNFYFNFFTKST